MAPAPDDLDGYEAAPCGLLTLAPDGKIRAANRTACAWTGFARADLLGRRFQDLLTVGSKLFHQTHWMPLLQMQGSVAEVQLEIRQSDGRVVPVLVNAAKRAGDADGRIDVALFVAADRRKYERELLLARRRAEALELEFRTLAENSPDLIVRYDAHGRCLYANRVLERLTGRRVEEFVGRTIAEVGAPVTLADAWAAAVAGAFSGSEVVESLSVVAPDGSRRELEVRLVPERDAVGAVPTVLGIARDVTSLRESEREAKQRAEFAEQLIGIVSHDLRNPLNAVTIGAQLLAGSVGAAQRRTVDRIASAAHRANRLIADLLDFTRARLGGGIGVEPIEIDPHAFVSQVLDEIRLATPGRAIEHRQIGVGTRRADPDRLAQVVTNLVGNALAYGKADAPVIVTTVIDGALEVVVHNEGAPIPPDLQSQIFEPMRRGDHASRGSSRSVGLGLYIVREIARAHGGSVEVRSSEAEGTTFRLRLPR